MEGYAPERVFLMRIPPGDADDDKVLCHSLANWSAHVADAWHVNVATNGVSIPFA